MGCNLKDSLDHVSQPFVYTRKRSFNNFLPILKSFVLRHMVQYFIDTCHITNFTFWVFHNTHIASQNLVFYLLPINSIKLLDKSRGPYSRKLGSLNHSHIGHATLGVCLFLLRINVLLDQQEMSEIISTGNLIVSAPTPHW